jgi:hypothetical protein
MAKSAMLLGVGFDGGRESLKRELIKRGISAEQVYIDVPEDWERMGKLRKEANHMVYYLARSNPFLTLWLVLAMIELHREPRIVLIFDDESLLSQDRRMSDAELVINKSLEVLYSCFPKASILGTRETGVEFLVRELS